MACSQSKRVFLSAILSAAIVACGGGGGSSTPPKPSPTAVTFYGASQDTGAYVDPNAGILQYLPDPVDQVSSFLGVKCLNRSVNGMMLSELVSGGVVAADAIILGGSGKNIPSFVSQLASDPNPRTVIAAGMVDAAFTERTEEEFISLMSQAIELVWAAKKTPILEGFNNFKETSILDRKKVDRLKRFDAIVRDISITRKVQYIDVSSMNPTFSPDGLHYSAESHTERARIIASQL
jgi:hypothetical protein